MMNVKACTTLNLDQDLEAETATDRNACPGSYPVDMGKVQSSLPQSSKAVPVTNDHMFTRHELNEENDPFPNALATPLNSAFSSPSENVDPRPPNTLNSVAPFSIAISLSDPSQTPRIPSSSEMLSDSPGLPPTQHSGTPNTDDIQSDSPSDLTGRVTRSSNRPLASGGFGDIYRGDLDMGGGLIDVRHRSFLSVKLNNHQVAIKTVRVYLEEDHLLPKKKKVCVIRETNEHS